MCMKSIAWVTGYPRTVVGPSVEMQVRGYTVVTYRNAIPAFEALTQGDKLSLVVVDPFIAPGLGEIPAEMQACRGMSLTDYYRFGVSLVELVTGERSTNRETPLIAVGQMGFQHNVGGIALRDALLEAGAVDYVQLSSNMPFEAFYDQLERLAQGMD